MSHHLILSMTPPQAPRWSPFSLVDLGHVEILLWSPPEPPAAHALAPAPTRAWRVLLSVVWPQRARVVRILGFPGRPTYWRRWPLTPAAAREVTGYLDQLREDCLKGRTGYRAISFNCFHVAYRCLQLAGLDPPPARQWMLFVPTLGFRAFERRVLRGIERSSMAARLAPGRARIGQ